jgi:DNA mismatch repair ATPase MutS
MNVAAMAGVPATVVARAHDMATQLEQTLRHAHGAGTEAVTDARYEEVSAVAEAALRALKSGDVEAMEKAKTLFQQIKQAEKAK